MNNDKTIQKVPFITKDGETIELDINDWRHKDIYEYVEHLIDQSFLLEGKWLIACGKEYEADGRNWSVYYETADCILDSAVEEIIMNLIANSEPVVSFEFHHDFSWLPVYESSLPSPTVGDETDSEGLENLPTIASERNPKSS